MLKKITKLFNKKEQGIQRPEVGREIATTGDGEDITAPWVGALALSSDSVLRNRGGADLEIYENVLSDDEVKSSFTQRQDAMISREYKIEPGGKRPIDIEAADFLRKQINKIGFDRVSRLMHFGVFYGYAVSEIVYGIDGQYIGWDKIVVRNRRRFRFSPTGELRLLTRSNNTTGIPCQAPYFWHYATGADHDDEYYGLGLAHWLYWPALFKRNDMKFWLIFLDKYGMPTAIGRYDEGATPEQKNMLLEATQAIQTDTGIILPKSMMIELMNITRSGAADYQALYDAMNNAIRRVIVGQTASSGGTPGRLGNDELQSDVLDSITKSDSDLICESFNRGPVTWLTKMNFPDAEIPTISRIFKKTKDEEADAEEDESKNKSVIADFSEPTNRPVITNVASAQLEQTANVMQPVVDGWINQIRELGQQVNTLEELRDGLETLLPNMTLDQYAEAMAQALAASALAGRYEVLQEVNNGR